MKFIFFLLSCCLLTGLTAQDTLSIIAVDTEPRLSADEVRGAKKDADQSTLFLIGVYNTVKYPRYARENGVRAMIGVTYVVDTEGKVVIEKTRTFTPPQLERMSVPEDDLVKITAFSTSRIGNGPAESVAPPRQTTKVKRLAKAHTAMEEAAAASILNLPEYLPGSHEGKPVAVRYHKFFTFRME